MKVERLNSGSFQLSPTNRLLRKWTLPDRARQQSLADERVLIDEHTAGSVDQFQRAARVAAENEIAVEIQRATEQRLGAERATGRIEASVDEDADVLRAAIGLDAIVRHVVEIIVVDVDGAGIQIRILLRRAVGGNIDAVMPVGDGSW